ncbi:Aorsin [Psilocybe cubensis]|uniref:Aorsin n=1 Tax=Psilocybe cubensis TaxID=181762 RepID=A0ACB8GHR4_PSICU|nr:Aorsin [Psilocybe cubensis]KAH9474907.1 Aorsin [Psilocybe cubensis]
MADGMRFSEMFYILVALLSLTLLAHANTSADSPSHDYILHEKRSFIPSGWSLVRRQQSAALIPLKFGLKQSNLDRLEEFLNDVSHPDSRNYGNHWTQAKIAETFAPSNHSINAARKWLTNEGFDASRIRLSSSKSWLQVNATVGEAERLLKTKYHVYEHRDGTQHIACLDYHLPAGVASHVEIVTPSIHFDVMVKRRGPSSLSAKNIGHPGVGITPKTTGVIDNIAFDLRNCDQVITPICLRALYGLVYEPLSAHKNSFGIVEYTPQAYVQSDLDKFHSNFSSALVGKQPKLVSIDGGIVQTIQGGFDYNGEANLDLQYAMNLVNLVGSKQEVTLYQVGDIPLGASFNNLIDALDGTYCTFEDGDDPTQDPIYPDDYPNGYQGPANCGTVKPANVISTSYGYNEADLSPFYAARQCAEYGKLGLMGVTVLFSSGDNGVAGNSDLCLEDDGSQTEEGPIFNPSFPSSCPYVTSVGATQVNPGATVTERESACEEVIASGGGFSNYFAMPMYQKNALDNYFRDHRPTYSGDIWNSTGNSRAYPDIAANGANYAVVVDGRYTRLFGTSAAAPVVGAILTMINDARITVGKKPIGFINPAIYSNSFSDAFNDITSGKNSGCGTDGYSAVPGWDPVTGLGTPSFPKLVARWLLLP